MKKTKNKKEIPQRDYYIINTKILEIVEKINFGDKIKTVFKCQSNQSEPRTCILWRDTTLKEGDNVEMKGFFADIGNAFIVKSIYRKN